MSGFEDSSIGGENPLDIPLDDFEGSIIGSEPALPRKSSHRSESSMSAAVPGSSGGAGGSSEHGSHMEPVEEAFNLDMDVRILFCSSHPFSSLIFSRSMSFSVCSTC